MALSVEDGTGKADAESLASVAAYKARCDARGVSYVAYADASIEQDLRKATDFMAVYRERWSGYRTTAAQALDFPRYNMPIRDVAYTQYYANDAVPVLAINACIDLAVRVRTAPLQPDLTRTIKREKTGDLETEYVDGAPEQTRYDAIEAMLAPLFKFGGAGSIRVSRA